MDDFDKKIREIKLFRIKKKILNDEVVFLLKKNTFTYKAGEIFNTNGGLVCGIRDNTENISYLNSEYFEMIDRTKLTKKQKSSIK